MTLHQRFWSKTMIGGEGCWEWIAAKDDKGYGRIGVGGRKGRAVQANRIAWMLTFGDPGDFHVLHKCDNPGCVRPSHLFLGTHGDNMRDMHSKGRHIQAPKSTCNHGHEFTEENTYHISVRGIKTIKCKTCSRIRCREYYAKRRAS